MSAGTWNITAEQGVTWQPDPIELTDDAGAAIDLTGYTAELAVKAAYADEADLLTLTTENGGLTLGGAAGTIAPLATATQMAALDVPNAPGTPARRKCVYALTITLGAVVIRLLEGTFTITRKV
ncbi:MAG: hypothetical protein HYY97_15805 [Rhodocyclales bacterium]|nr:hypothetical protein [Rhodocyclales bacterium]